MLTGSKTMAQTNPTSNPSRVLVVAAETIAGDPIAERIHRELEDENVELMVVAPALTGSALKHAMGDVDEARQVAEERLADSIDELSESGEEIRSDIVDSDPLLGIDDALATFPADRIILVTRPEDGSRWLEGDLFERARRKFRSTDRSSRDRRGGGWGDRRRTRQGARRRGASRRRIRAGLQELPPLSKRDIAGIVVAVVGTVVAVALAATSGGDQIQRDGPDRGVGSDGSSVFAYIVAGVIALANVAHVVGLLLFEAVRYRGGWARAFSWISLVGTPAAIVLILIAR